MVSFSQKHQRYFSSLSETRSCSQCGLFDEPICNYDSQFSSIISMVITIIKFIMNDACICFFKINQSPNGALQNLSEQLTQFTPEQSIVLFDTIINQGINTTVMNATEV